MQLRERLLLWWGRRHIGEVIRRRALRRALRVHCKSLRQGRMRLRRKIFPLKFLDAGCGRGDNALWAARTWLQAQVDAVDMDPALVALVERRVQGDGVENVQVAEGDLEIGNWDLGIRPKGEYAIIYSVDVFEHLKDPVVALRHLASLLAPDGAIVLHVPRLHQQRFFKRFAHYEQHDHEREGFAPDDIERMAAAAGLCITTMRHTFGPPGALAWELFHLAQGVGKWCALLTYPVPWVLAQIDGWVRWRRGNGMLVTMQKNIQYPISNTQ